MFFSRNKNHCANCTKGTFYGQSNNLYLDMLNQPHVLIAGATGSGKSVAINGVMYNALFAEGNPYHFILIDVKRVELALYRNLPNVLRYADDVPGALSALEYGLTTAEKRFKAMQKSGSRKYTSDPLWIVIDELADLMTVDKKHVAPLLQRICQLGRAANVHVLAATQCPLSAVIPTPIKVNFDACLGLRTRSAQDSRNILQHNGCEKLPRYGFGYWETPETPKENIVCVDMYSDEDLQAVVSWRQKAHKHGRCI